ncbi:maltose ABC transporter substrate-binding protein [Clostridium sp. BJN0001]|uniref:sugar ABC transporter substrate-binding protein n=1 Tax=Clostridium sp. BJN0001 TaxID=2930219 RepID=UPI001FD18BDA|nr:maltose ABC transporter substrate-binding protein [Clostridium sp. BJN0001]
MIKKTKMLALVMAATLAAGTLAGCGSSKSEGEDKTLTVWSHLTDAEVEALQPVVEKWSKDNGVAVKLQADKSDMQAFIQAANSSKGPDIMFGLANDNLGTFQKAGTLAEVPEGIINEDEYTSKNVVDAVTLDGKQYAVPIAQETIALFYNKDKVKEVPKTMEEVVELGKTVGFRYAVADFYRSFGFLSAQGGYVFKDNNGTLDPSDIGLGNEGAVKGYQFIQDLVVKNELMAPDITDDIAKGDFQSGASAFYISGPWDIQTFKDAGVNFGVVPMPTLGGKNVSTFMGVQAAFVSSKSKNKDLAWKLVKYLTENSTDALVEKGNRIPATKAGVESDTFKNRENMDQFLAQAKLATPMPNISEVQAMWGPGEDGIKALVSGQLDAQACGDQIVAQIKEGIAQQK